MIVHGVRSPKNKRGFKWYDLRFVHQGELPIEGSNCSGFINNSEQTTIGLLTNNFALKDDPSSFTARKWESGRGQNVEIPLGTWGSNEAVFTSEQRR